MKHSDEHYMKRALQLAELGYGFTSPNPMVGAVIVDDDGTIIGQGWHRLYGKAHAEVNAVNSVKDPDRLKESTIYVTLEPCSHYGKTPPCALLLTRCGFRRVVIGCTDPFPEVSGRGIRMIEEAGIEVTVGVLEKECLELNRRFMTAHRLKRPYIVLKWAQSEDGFLAGLDEEGNPVPTPLSTPLTQVLMHRERAATDAILVGSKTAEIDRPRLDTRLWPARKNPLRITFAHRADRHIPADFDGDNSLVLDPTIPLSENLYRLYSEHNIISLMVEGGATTLKLFLESGLVDELRVETSDKILGQGVSGPEFSGGKFEKNFPGPGSLQIRMFNEP